MFRGLWSADFGSSRRLIHKHYRVGAVSVGSMGLRTAACMHVHGAVVRPGSVYMTKCCSRGVTFQNLILLCRLQQVLLSCRCCGLHWHAHKSRACWTIQADLVFSWLQHCYKAKALAKNSRHSATRAVFMCFTSHASCAAVHVAHARCVLLQPPLRETVANPAPLKAHGSAWVITNRLHASCHLPCSIASCHLPCSLRQGFSIGV